MKWFKKVDSTWNYIVINGTKYLVDLCLAAGKFNEQVFTREYTDIYFATKPEIFINKHFPKDINWQLLSQPITLEKFDSLPYIDYTFFLYGFKTFAPDYKEIKIRNKEIKFELTYDPSITNGFVIPIVFNQTLYFRGNADIVKSNGKT